MFEEHENFLFQNENNVVLNETNDEGKPCIDRESKSLELTIQLYSCYEKHEAPSSCNTTVYLSLWSGAESFSEDGVAAEVMEHHQVLRALAGSDV